ncbi:hypothetical protein [Marinoscillum pacificum]|nr:hypothetical protein [Marinoscillum pacificum]
MTEDRLTSTEQVEEKPRVLELIRLSTLTLLVLIFLSLLYVG